MAISARLPDTVFLLLITLLSLLPIKSLSSGVDPLVSELLSLQSQSPSRIIRLDDHLVKRFLNPTNSPRSFTLLIFFDARQLHSKPELQLQSLKSEFALVATSFIANNEESPSRTKLFFCDIEFEDSQATFALFGVNALPHIRLIPPNARNLNSDSHQMDAGDSSRLAESIAEFIDSKARLSVGPIHRPPVVSKKQWMFIVAAFMILLPFTIKKSIAGQTLLHDPKIWLTGAVFVYFFSVSGTMHNIIRKMPLFLADRSDPSKLIFFYQGSGMQLGAEGFAVGFLYTIVGLLLAFVTHVLVRVRNLMVQRFVMLFVVVISFWAVKKVLFLDHWKTGYSVHMYLPSSWR